MLGYEKADFGNPRVFGTLTIPDGMSMCIEGMKYSLVSRGAIADYVETIPRLSRTRLRQVAMSATLETY